MFHHISKARSFSFYSSSAQPLESDARYQCQHERKTSACAEGKQGIGGPCQWGHTINRGGQRRHPSIPYRPACRSPLFGGGLYPWPFTQFSAAVLRRLCISRRHNFVSCIVPTLRDRHHFLFVCDLSVVTLRELRSPVTCTPIRQRGRRRGSSRRDSAPAMRLPRLGKARDRKSACPSQRRPSHAHKRSPRPAWRTWRRIPQLLESFSAARPL